MAPGAPVAAPHLQSSIHILERHGKLHLMAAKKAVLDEHFHSNHCVSISDRAEGWDITAGRLMGSVQGTATTFKGLLRMLRIL